MKKAYIVPVLFFLASCQGGTDPVDGQKYLSTLDGPKVPTVDDTLLESAQQAEKNGDFKQAVQLYKQVLEKQPDNKKILLSLADCTRRSGDNDEALALYDGLLKEDSGNLAAKEGKALALMAKGDFNAPGPLLEEVMKADGTRWKTLNALGILFTTRNMQPQAQLYFQAALKYHPGSATITNNLGLSLALSRRYDVAITTLRTAANLAAAGSAERKRIDMNEALVYAINGDTPAAREIAQKYYSGAELDNNMGLYAHLAKDDQEARAYLNMALSESKVFYAKAWDNLKDISENGSPDMPDLAPAAGGVKDLSTETTAPANDAYDTEGDTQKNN